MSTSYRNADGSFSSQRSAAVLAGNASNPSDAAAAGAAAWLRVEGVIPPQFAVGTMRHETNYVVNERDVEPNGHTTAGVFQLDLPTLVPFVLGDAVAAGMPEKNVYDLDDACAIFAARCRYYLARIFAAAADYNSANGIAPFDESNPPADVWAYVAIAHNQGLGSASSGKGALGSIAQYGLDWSAYKQRNAGAVNIATDRGSGVYGDDVISGGPDFTPGMATAPFDGGGALTIDAYTSSRLRFALLLGLVAACLYFFVLNRTPLKGTI